MVEVTFGQTFSSGIQDISAFLPILGTDQCKVHVGSALEGGYLYAAASPLSMFGCLGIVQASIVIFVTSLSAQMAKMTRDAGFSLRGTTASMIQRVPEGSPMKFLIEVRFMELRRKHHIENIELEVTQSSAWNAFLIATTFLLSLLGITPYIPIIVSDRQTSPVTVWVYPLLRIMGSASCAVAAQVAIQSRIEVILRSSNGNEQSSNGRPSASDPEQGTSKRRLSKERKRRRAHLYLLLSQLFLVTGIGATVVGYIGCFMLVQNTKSLNAILWLGLEATLSVLRISIWAWNPPFDDHTGVTVWMELIDVKLDPIPTQDRRVRHMHLAEIRQGYQLFLVVDEHSFLEHVTAYIGPAARFIDSGNQIAIYYSYFGKGSSSDARHLLLTTVLFVETRECFVLENISQRRPVILPPLAAYVAYLPHVHGTGMIRVRYYSGRILESGNKHFDRLERIHRHSQRLIDRISGVGRSDRLQVNWTFQSPTRFQSQVPSVTNPSFVTSLVAHGGSYALAPYMQTSQHMPVLRAREYNGRLGL